MTKIDTAQYVYILTGKILLNHKLKVSSGDFYFIQRSIRIIGL